MFTDTVPAGLTRDPEYTQLNFVTTFGDCRPQVGDIHSAASNVHFEAISFFLM